MDIPELLRHGRFREVDTALDGLDGDDIDDYTDKAIADDDILTLIYLVGANYAYIYPDGLINALKNNSRRAFEYILFKEPKFMTEDLYKELLVRFKKNNILTDTEFEVY